MTLELAIEAPERNTGTDAGNAETEDAETEDAEKALPSSPATHKSLMMLPLRNLMDFLKYTPGRWG